MRKTTLLFQVLLWSLTLYGQSTDAIGIVHEIEQARLNYENGHYVTAKKQLDSLLVSSEDLHFLDSKLLQAKINNELGYFELAYKQVDTIITATSQDDILYWDALFTKAEINTSFGGFTTSDSLLQLIEKQLAKSILPASWQLRMGNSRAWLALSRQDLTLTKRLLLEHKIYQDSLNIPSPTTYLLTLRHLADLSLYIGDIKKTKAYLKEGKQFAQQYQLLTHNYYGQLCEIGGYMYFDLEEYHQAIHYQLITDTIYLDSYGVLNDMYNYNLTNLGVSYSFLEDFPNAEKRLMQALERDEKVLSELDTIFCQRLHNVASMYKKAGDYQRSLDIEQRAEKIWKEVGGQESKMYAIISEFLGELQMELGAYEAAIPYLEKSIVIFTKTKAWKRLINSYNLLGKMEMDKGNLSLAERYIQESLKVGHQKLGNNSLKLAGTYQLLGEIALEKQKYTQALKAFYKAKSIQKETIGYQSINYAKSESLCAQALEQVNQPSIAAKTIYRNANVILEQQLQYIFPTLNESARIQFLSHVEEVTYPYMNFVQNHIANYPYLANDLQDLKLAIDGLSLESSRNLMLSATNGKEDNVHYHEWLNTRKKLRKAYVLSTQQQEKERIDITALQNEVQLLEKKLGWQLDSFRQKKLVVKDIQKRLTSTDLILDFFHYQVGDSTIYSVLINKKSMEYPKLLKLATDTELRPFLGQNIKINSSNYLSNLEHQEKLYRLIGQAIEPYLKGIQHIHIIPSGLLHRLSFATLTKNKKQWIDNFEITYHQTLRDWLKKSLSKKKESQKSMALLGGAIYDIDTSQLTGPIYASLNKKVALENNWLVIRGQQDSLRNAAYFSYLPGTKTEVEQIGQIGEKREWEVQTFIGHNALEDNLKALVEGESPTILHLATHGFFFEKLVIDNVPTKNLRESLLVVKNPLLRSGLAFTGANYAWVEGKNLVGREDGILTAFEIYNMDLQQTELVVLSACETARGDIVAGDGVFGLQRAFKLAGVDKLLLSLWKVPDQATAELMNFFYYHYLKGTSASKALQKAQKQLKKRYAPYDWSAFILLE